MIYDALSFLWNYQRTSKEESKRKAAELAGKHSEDISSEDLEHEMNHIAMVHIANLSRRQLGALELLN